MRCLLSSICTRKHFLLLMRIFMLLAYESEPIRHRTSPARYMDENSRFCLMQTLKMPSLEIESRDKIVQARL